MYILTFIVQEFRSRFPNILKRFRTANKSRKHFIFLSKIGIEYYFNLFQICVFWTNGTQTLQLKMYTFKFALKTHDILNNTNWQVFDTIVMWLKIQT